MEKIRVIGGTLHVGIGTTVRLSKLQSDRRLHGLNLIKNDIFKVTQPLEFKMGEELHLDLDDVPKHQRGHVEAVDDDGKGGKGRDGGRSTPAPSQSKPQTQAE